MKLEDGQLITLDNKKDYIIVKQIEVDSDIYAYLMTDKKPIEILIAKMQYINDKAIISIIDSKEELNKIVKLFEN